MRPRLLPQLLLAALVAAAVPVAGQTNCGGQADKASFNSAGCSVNHSVSAVMPYLATITSNSLAGVTIAQPTHANLGTTAAAGYTAAATGPQLTIAANFTYTLTASSGGFATVGAYTKAADDLEIGTNTSAVAPSTFTAMGTAVTLAASQAPTAASSTLFTYFRMKMRWASDLPGTYSATVTYTLTAP